MRRRTKYLVLRASIILIFAILAGRVWYVQVVMGSYYRAQGDTSKIRREPVQALRGIVYDRNGVPLLYNGPAWRIDVVPHGIPAGQASGIYARLAALLHGHPSAHGIAATVARYSWRPYAPVQINTSPVPMETAMIVKQLHLQFPGVRAALSSQRQYRLDPQWTLSHVLGYTTQINPAGYAAARRDFPLERYQANDVVGADGIEATMEPYLHGVNGTEQVMVDAGERPVRVLQPARTVPGDDVYLTLNGRLQRAVAADLATGLQRLNLRKGVAIVEKVNTGEILAMASLPSFDANTFSGGISLKKYSALRDDPAHPLFNLATQGQFAPGSTFKIVTAAAALQSGAVTPSTTIVDTGSIPLRCPGTNRICQTYYGWQPAGLGPENVVGALAQSSDIYFYSVSGGNPNIDPNMPYIGADRLATYAHQFGLAHPTGIELPAEAAGFVPSRSWFNAHPIDHIVKNPGEAWHIGNTYNMAIGQGQNIATPLQMVNLTAAIANGGTLYRPRIIQHISGQVALREQVLKQSQVIQPFVPSIIRKGFIDPSFISLIQEGMHDSVAWTNWRGTSWLAHDPRIDAAGKTGTAEATGGAHSWWVGYAPFNNPQIAVVVVAPNAASEGAYTAAPIAHKIFEDYFHLKPRAVPGEALWPLDVSQQLPSGAGAQ